MEVLGFRLREQDKRMSAGGTRRQTCKAEQEGAAMTGVLATQSGRELGVP